MCAELYVVSFHRSMRRYLQEKLLQVRKCAQALDLRPLRYCIHTNVKLTLALFMSVAYAYA